MVFDLVAGTRRVARRLPAPALAAPPRLLVFDSGLGGLTVYPEITAAVPGGEFLYLADDAVFPYGDLSEAALVERVQAVMDAIIPAFRPDVVVIACGTASTLVLPPLRSGWPGIDFVGTVPAIKPAAAQSESGLISVLATPGTVARQYTRELVEAYAGPCRVTLVGARRLARAAEEIMRGGPLDAQLLAEEIAPAFVSESGRRTDTVVLACTHYPLLLPQLERVAPWPVRWIDPAAAIARRVRQVLEPAVPPAGLPAQLAPALFTSDVPPRPELAAFLAARGLKWQSSAGLAALPRATIAG